MPGEGSLFERIRSASLRDDLESSRDPDEVARSVCRNLERVLNNWRGSVSVEPTLGMPDDAFNGSSQEKIGRRVALLVKENIRDFEPRLTEVHVMFVERDPTEFRAWEFRVEGRLITAEGRPRAVLIVRRRADRYTVHF
jgi:type VI secretion system lysozyme-like protein